MKKIKIAVTPRLLDIDNNYIGVNQQYVAAFNENDAVPYMVSTDVSNIENIVEEFDGLLVTGGVDIEPTFYGEERKFGQPNHDHDFDVFDLAIIKAFRAKGKPILGVCRGLQAINVAYGGNLYQDVDTFYKDLGGIHKESKEYRKIAHKVEVAKDSKLYEILKEEITDVNSYHHQAIDRLAEGFKVSARSLDGVIEAIEADNIIAVQWHPEKMRDVGRQNDIFKEFIKMCQNNQK